MKAVTDRDMDAIAVAYDELLSYYETVGDEGSLDDEEMPSGKIPWALDRLKSLLGRPRAEQAAAVAVLRRIEWCWEQTGEDESDGVNRCPACGRLDTDGHDRSCDLAAALAGALAPESGSAKNAESAPDGRETP